MKNKLIALLLPFLLTACAQMSVSEYSQKERVALVIIGMSGNTPWSELTSTDKNIHRYEFPEVQADDVVLMPVSVGTRFQLLEMSHQHAKGSISHEFKGSPMLNIYKDKIYYYGVIQSFVSDNKQLRTRIVTQVDQSVIDRARQKYPEIFKRKPDVQFKNDDLSEDLMTRKEVNWENTSASKYYKSKQRAP